MVGQFARLLWCKLTPVRQLTTNSLLKGMCCSPSLSDTFADRFVLSEAVNSKLQKLFDRHVALEAQLQNPSVSSAISLFGWLLHFYYIRF